MTTVSTERYEADGAACTIYREAPRLEGRRTAAIGDFAFDSADGGAAALRQICAKLRDEGFEAVLAPMNGSTWHAYRVVTESDGSLPFALELQSGVHDLPALEAARFRPVSRYVSTRAPLDAVIGAPPPAMDGLTLARWEGEDTNGLIETLYLLSSERFASNPFYRPISREAFVALYQPLRPYLAHCLILLARDGDGAPVGYLFGLPDFAEGESPRTAIIKTYASARRGVGRLMADRFHREVQALGFTQVIHALMHEDNLSRASSGRFGAQVFRRYALMGRTLG